MVTDSKSKYIQADSIKGQQCILLALHLLKTWLVWITLFYLDRFLVNILLPETLPRIKIGLVGTMVNNKKHSSINEAHSVEKDQWIRLP